MGVAQFRLGDRPGDTRLEDSVSAAGLRDDPWQYPPTQLRQSQDELPAQWIRKHRATALHMVAHGK